MQYRLLRNNKETGPYTKSQLEEMGLKPYDLLWIEGRGGAWQYASEINDLKSIAPVVEEQPYDRFYKGKEKQSADKQTTSNTTTTASSGIKTPKPRFRISGDKIIMVENNAALPQTKPAETIAIAAPKPEPIKEPVTVAPATPVINKQENNKPSQTVGPDWEEMYTEWKGDENVEEPAVAAAAVPSQTFEEIKQRYEESKLQHASGAKETKVTSAAKQNIMAAAAVIVLALGGYAGYWLNQQNDKMPAAQEKPAVEKAEIIPDEPKAQADTASLNQQVSAPAVTPPETSNTVVKQDAPNEINNTLSSAATIKKPAADSLLNKVKPTPLAKAPAVKNAPVAPVKPKVATTSNTALTTATKTTLPPAKTTANKQPATVPIIAKKTDVPVPVKDNVNDADVNNVQKANTAAPVQIPTASQTTTVKQIAPKKRIGDYVTINKVGNSTYSASVQNVQLSVKNITDFPIDLAVVDIQYYGANGRFQKGETMYVKNIASGDNINVRVPDSKTSKTISYKISLVSAEQKTLYLVGD